MINVIEIIASLIESIILTEFTTRALGLRNKKYAIIKYISYLLLSIADIIILPLFIKSDIIPGVAHLILTFAFSLIFLKGSIFFKLFIAVLSNISILIINIGIMTIFSFITNLDFNGLILNQTSTRILLLFTTKFIYFLFTRIMLKVFGKDRYPLTAHNWYIIISLLLLSIMCGWIIFGLNLYSYFSTAFLTVSVLLIVVINTAVYIIMVALSKYNLAKSKIEMYENIDNEIKTIKSRNKYYSKLEHELKNNSIMIQTLIKQGNLEEAEKMIEGISDINLGSDKQFIKLNHAMLETIINNRLTICERENIRIEKCVLSGVTDNLGNIMESDLCTVLGNLLDNAIEACRKCKGNKNIEISITNK